MIYCIFMYTLIKLDVFFNNILTIPDAICNLLIMKNTNIGTYIDFLLIQNYLIKRNLLLSLKSYSI